MEKAKMEKEVKGSKMEKEVKMEMVSFKGLDFEGKEITVNVPKSFMFGGYEYAGNTDYEFTFSGNKQQSRVALKRSIDFKRVISEEVKFVSILQLNETWKAIALLGEYEKNGEMKKRCLNVSITNGKDWLLANGIPATAIDCIGLVLKVKSWNTAHGLYKKLVNRNDEKTGTHVKEDNKGIAFTL